MLLLRKFVNFFGVAVLSALLLGCTQIGMSLEQKVLEDSRESFVKIMIETEYDAYACYEQGNVSNMDLETDCMWIDTIYSQTITGSGFSIKNIEIGTVILTAGHVCEQKNESSLIDSPFMVKATSTLYAIDINGTYHKGEILEIDHSNDICSIILYKSKIPNLRFSKIDPKPGERVYNLSAPRGIFNPNNIMIFDGFYWSAVRF